MAKKETAVQAKPFSGEPRLKTKYREEVVPALNEKFHYENVMMVCPKCGKATRVAHQFVDGKKVRVCKKCGKVMD